MKKPAGADPAGKPHVDWLKAADYSGRIRTAPLSAEDAKAA
jgi:hypothetical protein